MGLVSSSTSRVELGNAVLMVVYISLCHLVFAALGWAVGRLLKRSAEFTAAFMMIAVFGNVGNFGIPLIRFRLGDSALGPATIYYESSGWITVVFAPAPFQTGG